MDIYRVNIIANVTFIEDVRQRLTVKVERDRSLPGISQLAVIETLLYKEESCFVESCRYVFEVVEGRQLPEIAAVYEMINFFFHTILNTTLFIKRIPVCSSFYVAPEASYENVNDIHVDNLYEILSGN